jgi:uncharacterized cupredoxin-like copper-binding protein
MLNGHMRGRMRKARQAASVARAILGSALIAAAGLGIGSAGAGAGAPGHSHDHATFSAGEPGNPASPSRTIEIKMTEGDGKMAFVPARIEVRQGEQIRFVLRNEGELDHEMVLASLDDNLKHAEVMKKNPDMEHDDPNGKRLAPKGNSAILWKFTKAGEFDFSCLIPGHREAGMSGTVAVRGAKP